MSYVASAGGLPIQPLLACAADVVRRIGRFDLAAVQFLMPLHLGAVPVRHLQAQHNWFAAAEPTGSTPIRLTVDAGEDGTQVVERAAVISAALVRRAGPVLLDTWTADPAAAAAPRPPLLDDLWWLGEDRHPVTFTGTAIEWSTEAIGYAAALVAWACYETGVATPIALSVEKLREDPEATRS